MEILSQTIKNLKSISYNIYELVTFLEPLSLLSDSDNSELSDLLNEPNTLSSLDKTLMELNNLNHLLIPIKSKAKSLTKINYHKRMTPYAPFIIDEPPLKETYKQLSFDDILAESNHTLQPRKRYKELEYEGLCQRCGAPNDYVRKHTKKQFICDACKSTFTIKPTYHDEIIHKCPHCKYKLSLHHERENYDVLICSNHECSFYLKNKGLVDKGEGDHLLTSSNWHKLKYTFRLFNFDLSLIKAKLPLNINSKIDLGKIYHSQYTLGLILTYYINYGLSSRKVSKIMSEIHGIKISHQTIFNYAEAVAVVTEVLNESYPYELDNTITFDETYIKVMGKHNYVFFGSDTKNKIITSYRIFDKRDTECAVISLNQTFNKYETLPEDLTIITDGNPIYNAAQVFFKMNDINFDLYQVIGIKNNDEVSTKYRSHKQIEERLNRTYKFNYYGTNGYGSNRNANVYISVFTTFHNFLRPHSSLNYKPPIEIPILTTTDNMPTKWLYLIDYTIKNFSVKSSMKFKNS